MKTKSLLFTSLLTAGVVASNLANAQEEEKKVTVYGNVHNNVWYNTRASSELRDGIFNLFPSDHSAGTANATTKNDDTNAKSTLGFSAIFSRLGVKFSGGTAFGAKVSGFIEGDFFGVSGNSGNGSETLFRLRHAAVDLDWTKTQLRVGQYWNPNFLPECFPTVPNFALAINPFSFIPQVRVTHKVTPEISVMAMAHMNNLAGFSSMGSATAGTTGAAYSTNSTTQNGVAASQFAQLPSFAGQLKYDNKTIWAVVGGEVNFLRPIVSEADASGAVQNISKNMVVYNFLASAKLTLPKMVTVKLRADYGQNYNQYVGVGYGYAYKGSDGLLAGYRAANVLNTWGEVIVTKHDMFQPALFVGYVRNLGVEKLGTGETIMTNVYSRGLAMTGRVMEDFIRVAPRLDVRSGKYLLALEYEWSQALWGDSNGTTAEIKSSSANEFKAQNHRVTASVVYSF